MEFKRHDGYEEQVKKPPIESLLVELNYLVDDDVAVDDAIRMFNEAQRDLSDIIGYEKEVIYSMAQNEQGILLPDDFIEEYTLVLDDGKSQYTARKRSNKTQPSQYGYLPMDNYYTFRIFDNKLIIEEPPRHTEYKLILKYQAELPEIPDSTADPSLSFEPKLPRRFWNALVLFGAFKYFQNWEDNDNLRREFYDEYNLERTKIQREALKRKSRSRSRSVYTDRGWY